MGFPNDQMTAHGFRTSASSLLNESGKWNPDAIERALAHMVAGSVRRIYNQSAYWGERVAMAQWWSDYLDELRDGGNVPSQREKIEGWTKMTTPAPFGELSYGFSMKTKTKHEGNWTTLSAR
jgi:hypothetical protein